MKNFAFIFIVISCLFVNLNLSGQDFKLVFSDEFNSNSNNWKLRGNIDLLETIEKGHLFIHTINPKFANRTEKDCKLKNLSDFKLEVKLGKLQGDKSKFYGITWGASLTMYYAMLINQDGVFVVVRNKGSKNEYISNWKKYEMTEGADYNLLTLEQIKDSLHFFIDGKLVYSTGKLQLFGKRFGIFQSADMIVQTDYIKIYKPEKMLVANEGQQAKVYREEQKAGLEVEFKPVHVVLNTSIKEEQIRLKPNFDYDLLKLPEDSSYFKPLDYATIKANAKEVTTFQLLLADIYRVGWQMKEPNQKKALKYYQKAADNGDSLAFQRLAYYKYGIGGAEPDQGKFIEYLTQAANRGCKEAQYDLAILNLTGKYNVPKNWQFAAKWLEIYFKNENEPEKVNKALRILANMHFHHDANQYGIIPDLVMAIQYFKKAGDTEGINDLNEKINSFGKLRYLLNNKPEYLSGVNVRIDYSDIEQVKKLNEQIIANSEVFNADNLQDFSHALTENLLYMLYEKAEKNNDALLAFIEAIKHENWLKPYNKDYVEYAYRQIPINIDYNRFDEVQKYSEILSKFKKDVLAQKVRFMAIQTQFEKSKGDVAKMLEFNELMYRNKWLRDEVKIYYKTIYNAFNEAVIKSKALEVENNKDLFKPKGEFETSSDYASRLQDGEELKKRIDERYKEFEKRFIIQQIKFSHESIQLSVDEIGKYNADKEMFPVVVKGKSDIIHVPLREAPDFKKNIHDIEVLAEKQLLEDGMTWDIFNIKLRNPLTGSIYPFGKQKDPLYLDFVTEDDGSGVPNLMASIEFIEPSGNNILDAKEKGQLILAIKNSGNGFARNLNVSITTDSENSISFNKFKTINAIAPEEELSVYIDLNAPKNIQDGEIEFVFSFAEEKGFPPAPIKIKIPLQEYKEPSLMFVEAGIQENGNGNNIIENGEIIDVTALVQNRGQGKSLDTKVVFDFRDRNVINLTPEQTTQRLGTLDAGEAVKVKFSFVVNNNYSGDNVLPIFITLSESEGLYGGSFPLGLEMKKISMVATSVKVDGQYNSTKIIEDVSLMSEVDKNIPEVEQKNQNRYILIIGNEDYTRYQKSLDSEVNVDFARNDAIIFSQYAEKTLGIPKDNIFLKTDAISSVMETEIEKLSKISQYNPEAEIMFYYAGHGFPDEVSKESYIMPVDISGANVKAGVNLQDLYQKLTKYKPKRVTVFLDACFSGGGRNKGLLAARAVKIKPKDGKVIGNIVVFSASSGEQSSLPYKDKKHGMFTFFMLKKLQESKGNVTYRELFDYVKKQVQLNSVVKNSKEQNPEVNFSRDVLNIWENWSLEP